MKYIYESPDKGKTVYRYPVGQYEKRELVIAEPEIEITDDGIITIIEN